MIYDEAIGSCMTFTKEDFFLLEWSIHVSGEVKARRRPLRTTYDKIGRQTIVAKDQSKLSMLVPCLVPALAIVPCLNA